MSHFRMLGVACLSAFVFAGAAVAAPAVTQIAASEQGAETLTLSGAKQIVTHRLAELGKTNLRAGRAEFAKDGNVSVEILTLQGITVDHVRVDAKSGQVTNAHTGAPLAMNG